MIYYILGLALFICGLGLYYALASLWGIYSIIISLPLAMALGWITGELWSLENE